MSKHKSSIKSSQLQQLENTLSATRGYGLSLERLQSEIEFIPYMQMLKSFAQRYCVMIVTCDTPVGPFTTRQETGALKNIGLNTDLFEKYRCPYAALIDAGVLVFEQINLDTSKIIDKKLRLDEDEIELISVSFDAQIAPRETCIKINNKVRSSRSRGVNIVVYDKVTKSILDTVSFDTYVNTTLCNRPNMEVQLLRKFAAAHPDVSVICWRPPIFPSKNLSADE